MAHTTATRRATLNQPNKAEVVRRMQVMARAMHFVLDPQEGSGNLPRVFMNPQDGQEHLTGHVAEFISMMFELYPYAKTSSTLSAQQSAINLARMHFKQQGLDVNTQGAEPNTPGAAFALATVFFHKAIEASEEA